MGVPLLALYISTPKQWRAHDIGDARIDFEYRTLCALATELGELGIRLHCLYAEDYAHTPAVLLNLCAELSVQHVCANRQYEFNETARDRVIHRQLRAKGIGISWHHDQCLTAPEQIRTGDGQCYSVFTPYKNKVLNILSQQPPSICHNLSPLTNAVSQPNAVPTLTENHTTSDFWGDYRATPDSHDAWPAGESAALARLAAFCSEDLAAYPQTRDLPSIAGTSGLSPHLAVGALSARQCWLRAQQSTLMQEASGAATEKWCTELIWRDFYRCIMVGFPHVGQSLPFKRNTDAMRWLNDAAQFDAWCQGHTGYPIIDAAMRCLNATHFMHNRLRMICAMFLVKDLLIDWRWGERYFAQKLIDFDFASNNGGWQWSASTGNDAVPYFRIFNPTKQSQTYDASGAFIRTWVPELSGCSDKDIHAPVNPHALNYPEPIVEHSRARTIFLDAWNQL